jgi:SpoVK/Ycf46/Vps4 family AAA+-type ATPase
VFHGLLEQPGIDTPKGVLLLGVQGCGKSLAAKAIAGIWKVPLLRFDFGALYNKYIGESEKNLRESLKTAEVMAPCVMWIDEIEKGISGGNDDGTSKRVLGSLLTWLAENRSNVFIVATANNIDDLPPELIRKGRLDEIFFVDLPAQEVRKQIFSIHLDKRKVNLATVDLDRLAADSEGFSGAEIEQAVVSAIYSSYGDDQPLTTDTLLAEISTTRPLSVVMDGQIQQLRQWAESRTVPVD